MSEIWKDIPGYEGAYQASTLGNIRSLDRIKLITRNGVSFNRVLKGKVLRPGAYCKSGHMSVVLGHGKNGSPVHQLVAMTFLGPIPAGQDVRHKNGNPKDNLLENLEYGTRTENILDVYTQGKKWRKLSLEDAKNIKILLKAGERGVNIAKKYGVSQTIVSAIKKGRIFAWVQ